MNSQEKPKANILYVDDDDQNLSSFKALFRREYNVFLASSAKTALDVLNKEEIQVLITDQRMPEMSGTELLELAAEKFPKSQRFLLTAFSDFDPLVEAINKGKLQGYFSKPIDDKFIRSRIEEGLANYYLERENRELMQKIQEKERFLSAILENIPDVVFVKDAKTLKYLEFNKAGEMLLGIARDQVIGKEAQDILAEKEAEISRQTDQKVLENLCLVNVPEEKITCWNEEIRFFSTKKIPIIGNDGKPRFVLGVSRDITDQLLQQEREKHLEKQLIQSQKMEAIGTLAARIAHDFNNILVLMMGHTELALSEIHPGSDIKEYLDEVFKAGKRGRDLIAQIVEFSRPASREAFKPVMVEKIVMEIFGQISGSSPKNIKLIHHFECNGWILGSSGQIHQVFMNLCVNAIFAMRDIGGVLEIRGADLTIETGSPLTIAGIRPASYLKITVSDNGIGIPAKIIDIIFQPYVTTKKSGEGTGIGLAIVHNIIESHGGKIFVSSEEGKGTIFTIYLPSIKQKSAP